MVKLPNYNQSFAVLLERCFLFLLIYFVPFLMQFVLFSELTKENRSNRRSKRELEKKLKEMEAEHLQRGLLRYHMTPLYWCKQIPASVLDMINAVYHDKPLVFIYSFTAPWWETSFSWNVALRKSTLDTKISLNEFTFLVLQLIGSNPKDHHMQEKLKALKGQKLFKG